jgi:hypothetical protein
MNFQQKSFGGGIDLISPDSDVAEDGYIWLVNGRQRFGYIEPNKKNRLITDAPEGLKQGIIAIGNILILFIAGKAYYQEDSTTGWIQIPGLLMSTTAPLFYSVAIPASTFNFVRKLDTGLSIHAPIRATTDFKVAGTPSGILVQDGINQSWLIEYDSINQVFTSRVTKNFAEWNNVSSSANDREYVPIGKQMMYKDGILYIVSPDLSQVFRSVTGRPLDFIINVDVNGNKAPSELQGGAMATSFAFDFDEITCITEIDVPDAFIYATRHNTRIVVADYTQTIFGEPTYKVGALLKNTGIVNQYSFTQSLNDFLFISTDSVKSFNAVQQLKFKGNSAIFTKQLARLLFNTITKEPIKQVDCSCIGFQNYILFNIDTLWRNIIAVYDVLLEKWVSLDITTAIRIKQYALIETELQTKLYCITQYNEVFQLYGDTENVEVAELRVRAFTNPATDVEHKSQFLRPLFSGGTFDGKVFVSEYVDDQLSADAPANTDYRYEQTLKSTIAGIPFPVIPPVLPNNKQSVDCPGFALTKGLTGNKISFIFQWTNDARLEELQLVTSDQMGQTSMKQRDLTYKSSHEPA